MSLSAATPTRGQNAAIAGQSCIALVVVPQTPTMRQAQFAVCTTMAVSCLKNELNVR